MHIEILSQLFGAGAGWHGPCIVLVDADVAVRTTGPDSITSGGGKAYAPRITSGRIMADAVRLLVDKQTLLLTQRERKKNATGEETDRELLLVIDVAHVIGLEFEDTTWLRKLGVPPAPKPEKATYAPGTLVG